MTDAMPSGPEIDALSTLFGLVYVCEDGRFYEDYDESMDLLREAKSALGVLAEHFYGTPPPPTDVV